MRLRDMAPCSAKHLAADVMPPQLATDVSRHCPFRPDSAKVRTDRTQAVCLLKRGLRGKSAPAFQEYWSRGCRRSHALFSHFVWLPLWQHALRKKKKLYLLMNRSRPSLPLQASTSNLLRRVGWGNPVRHAAVLLPGSKRTCSSENKCDLAGHRALLARLVLVLKTAAVPFIQDRSPC